MARLQPRSRKHSLVYHRVQSPRATYEWAAALARRCGVTRCGGITGLDRLGLPVFQSYRPNARSISVSAGKGIDRFAARTSALMEGIELHHAESVSPGRRFRYCDPPVAGDRLLDPGDFALPPHVETVRQVELDWLEGFDLFNHLDDAVAAPGRRVRASEAGIWAPYDAVHCKFDMATLAETPAGLFRTNSNGLASGFTGSEAVCHALCEVIERHCVIEWMRSREDHLIATRIELDSITDEHVQGLLARLHQRDVDVALWDVSGSMGVPVFRCALCDRSPDGFYTLMPSVGAGCHPSRSYAMIRAITEAVQARLTLIAGSREDISHSIYRAGEDWSLWNAQRQEIIDPTAGMDAADTPGFDSEYVEDDIVWLLERLGDAGFDRAVAVDLSRPEFGVPVMRVLVPGLQAPVPDGHRGAIDAPGADGGNQGH